MGIKLLHLLICFCCLAVMGCTQHKKQTEVRSIVGWDSLPDLPRSNKSDTVSLGISAPFAGISNGCLLVAGGSNFPDKSAAEGGSKKYYDFVWALDTAKMKYGKWKIAGKLPFPVAYGASVTIPGGVICIGGNNADQSFSSVYLLSWDRDSAKIDMEILPELPFPMDNISATSDKNLIYVAGGNANGIPSCSFLRLDIDSLDKGWEKLPDIPGSTRLQPVLVSQKTPKGVRIYLAGGYQSEQPEQAAVIPADFLSFNSHTNHWESVSFLPVAEDGGMRTLTGGAAIAYGDSALLFMGGVNYDRFMEAIDREWLKKKAFAIGDTASLNRLTAEGFVYLSHPVSWYKFNRDLLLYNTYTKKWFVLGSYEQLARAGAAIIPIEKNFIIIGGEIKPGLRTPKVNMGYIK